MLSRLKNYLGVEGVSLSLDVDGELDFAAGALSGTLVVQTLRPQTVRQLTLRLTERYARGRGEHKRIDDYLLGQLELSRSILLDAREEVAIPFVLGFAGRPNRLQESLPDVRLLRRAIASVAHLTAGVRSVYTLTAMASVEGVALDPVCAVQVYPA